MCELMSTVTPHSRLRRTIRSRMSRAASGSRPFRGSSSSSTSGSPSSASATPRRCFIPAEKRLTFCLPASAKSTAASSCVHATRGPTSPNASALTIMLSNAERSGYTPGCSMRVPTRGCASQGASCFPSTKMSPSSGGMRPAMSFMVVDLPDPFLPMSP